MKQNRRRLTWFATGIFLMGMLGQGYLCAQAVGLEEFTETGYETEYEMGYETEYEMETGNIPESGCETEARDGTPDELGKDGVSETVPVEGIQTEEDPAAFAERGTAALTAQNKGVELIAQRKNGAFFPEGYRIWFLSAEDTAMENGEEAERIRQVFQNKWKKELKRRYLETHGQGPAEEDTGLEDAVLESIKNFLPYYIKIVDEKGEEVCEEITLTFVIKEETFIRECGNSNTVCYLGIHQTEQSIEVEEKPLAFRDFAQEPVKISGSLLKSGWVSIAQVDTAWTYHGKGTAPEETESDRQDTEMSQPESGSMEAGQSESDLWETEQTERESLGEEQTESDQTEEENWEDEKDTRAVQELRPEVGIQLAGAAARSVSLGTKLPAGPYQAVSSGMTASAEYNGIIFRSGISSLELFGTASSKLVTGDTGSALYWQPVNTEQKGICGALYKKVLYNNANHQWYDIRLTLQTYTDSVKASDGNSHTCYPFVGFFKTRFGFSFYRAGVFVVKCELINSVSQKKEAVKFRLNIADIDDYQICGFKMGNGSINQRYCMRDNIVYYTENAAIAGMAGFEQLVGADIMIEPGDHRGDIIYDASGSEFYLAVGYGDNDEYSWEDTIKPRYDKAVAGTLTGGYGALEILAESTILPIDVPEPVKTVSTDGKTWGTSNTLSSAEGEYWYRVEQFIPEETASNYYDKFVMTDVLPAGVDFVGRIAATRVENNGNADSWFSVTTDNDTVTVTALPGTLGNAGFYGYHFAFHFKVKMDPSEISPEISGNGLGYTVKNTATVTARHKMDKEDIVKKAPEVTTRSLIERPKLPAPLKSLDGDQKITETMIEDREEEILFTIWQEVPAGRKELSPKSITVTDRLEDCLEYLGYSASQTVDFQNYTDNTSAVREEKTGQTLTFSAALPQRAEKVMQRIDIRCRIKQGYDLSVYLKNGFYEIANRAVVKLEYDYGNPNVIEENTNTVLVKLEAPPPIAILELTKEIDREDLVFAHGNPIFLFKAEGTDTKGNPHTYYQSVEFTKENGGEGQRKRLTAVIPVSAGTYTVTEERTLRYALAEIHSVTGGTVSGNGVRFDVTKTERAGAVFYNKKITDEELSHTALVKNHIGEQQK